jgi:hypothetical protein
MINSCFVAINIVSSELENVNVLLNDNNGFPIIFYWNGIDDIFDKISKDEKFLNIINNYVFNYDTYDKTFLKLAFINTENENIYNQKEVSIQELYSLESLNKDFMFMYLQNIVTDLYEKFFKEKYIISDIEDLTSKDIIKDIIHKIENNDKREILQSTIINYIRNKLNENTKLTKENKEYLINSLEDIIRES